MGAIGPNGQPPVSVFQAEVRERVCVVPHGDNFVRVERENTVRQLYVDGSVVDLRVVEMHLQRFLELRNREHQFTLLFEFRSQVVCLDYHCIYEYGSYIITYSYYYQNIGL